MGRRSPSLWGSTTPSPLVAPLRRRTAGFFADVAEGQLRLLFERFRQDKGPAALQKAAVSKREKDKFVKFLEGSHLGLGEMIFEIQAPRQELRLWLQRNTPRLLPNWDKSKAGRLNSFVAPPAILEPDSLSRRQSNCMI